MRCKIGIYNLHMKAMGGGEKLTLVLAEHLSSTHNVRLFAAEALDIPSLEQFFGVDLSRVTVAPLNSVGPLRRVAAKVPGIRGLAFSLHHYLQLKKTNLDIFINNSYASRLRCPAAQGIFICMFPYPSVHLVGENLTRRIRLALDYWIERLLTESSSNTVDSYSKVVTISQYSADWVNRMWKRQSQIIYPPCDDMGPPATKRNIILNVGRFIPETDDGGRHHKGQEILLDTFRRMTDLHRDGWELHFAGSVGSDKSSESFANTLMKQAGGIPVFFHFNAARDEMRDLYRRAAIYWHATGYGFDIHRYPAKQEHFGIATVEAMSAGAVPVVYSSGGQKEIVTNAVDGFWWDDIDGLVRQTRRLVNDPSLRCELSNQAIVTSKRFRREAFGTKMDQVIAELLSERTERL
jgi:glycosyltransferase involved in cell wall biosynthesis